MSSTKYEIEKFIGVNDFSLWCLKMEALLFNEILLEALKGKEKMDASLMAKEKASEEKES